MFQDFERGMRISKSRSGAPDVAYVEVFKTGLADRITHKLITDSKAELDESSPVWEKEKPTPFEFVGERAGAAAHEVWVMTRDGSEIEPYLEAIVEKLHAAFDSIVQIKEV